MRGIGFRDISLFNQAMLAKQCWRLITRPLSVVARVLKGWYFPTSSFLKAEIGNSRSYVWSSFVWGRELIVAGSRWRVGARSTISVYSDRWLPTPISFRVQSPPILGEDALVRSLISDSREWKVQLVRDSFVDEKAETANLLHQQG